MPTTEELLDFYEVENVADLDPVPDGYEVIDDELVEMPAMSTESSWVVGKVFRVLDEWCDRTRGGVALSGEAGFRCFLDAPRRVRKPDVSVLRADPATFRPGRGDSRDVPLVVVEVISPNDTVSDLDAKIREFFRAGTSLAWIVNPEERTVIVRKPDGSIRLLTDPADLTGEDVLPGFSVPLAAFLPRPPVAPPAA